MNRGARWLLIVLAAAVVVVVLFAVVFPWVDRTFVTDPVLGAQQPYPLFSSSPFSLPP